MSYRRIWIVGLLALTQSFDYAHAPNAISTWSFITLNRRLRKLVFGGALIRLWYSHGALFVIMSQVFLLALL